MYINWMEKVSLDGKENKNYTTVEIADLQKRAYYQGRADEEKKWKDLKDDLTTVYMNGFYDGEKKWKDKIKEKIKYIEENYSEHSEFSIEKSIEFLQELLEERD